MTQPPSSPAVNRSSLLLDGPGRWLVRVSTSRATRATERPSDHQPGIQLPSCSSLTEPPHPPHAPEHGRQVLPVQLPHELLEAPLPAHLLQHLLWCVVGPQRGRTDGTVRMTSTPEGGGRWRLDWTACGRARAGVRHAPAAAAPAPSAPRSAAARATTCEAESGHRRTGRSASIAGRMKGVR